MFLPQLDASSSQVSQRQSRACSVAYRLPDVFPSASTREEMSVQSLESARCSMSADRVVPPTCAQTIDDTSLQVREADDYGLSTAPTVVAPTAYNAAIGGRLSAVWARRTKERGSRPPIAFGFAVAAAFYGGWYGGMVFGESGGSTSIRGML